MIYSEFRALQNVESDRDTAGTAAICHSGPAYPGAGTAANCHPTPGFPA